MRLIGVGELEKSRDIPCKEKRRQPAAPVKTARAVFDGEEWDTPIYLRQNLSYGFTAPGPAIIEELTATTVVPPDFVIHVDEYHNLILKKEGQN